MTDKPLSEVGHAPSQSPEVAKFLDQLKVKAGSGPSLGRGRLIFALDATASREPTWDRACGIQGTMFEATAAIGGLDVKLVYYRGFDECQVSRWLSDTADLHRVMRKVSCAGGETQIERVLEHAIRETGKARVNALVFVGDAVEEKIDRLCQLAGELGSAGVPVFFFHEGHDPVAASAFKQMATLSKGAYLHFDLASVDRLKELLGAVAAYAAGGFQALEAYGKKRGGEVLRLTSQLHR
jgi:hypothetical protein